MVENIQFLIQKYRQELNRLNKDINDTGVAYETGKRAVYEEVIADLISVLDSFVEEQSTDKYRFYKITSSPIENEENHDI